MRCRRPTAPGWELVIWEGSVESGPGKSEEVRRATLRAIAAEDTYLPETLAESDSILRRWVDRERRPLLVYFEPTAVSGYTTGLGRAVRDAFSRWRRVGGIPIHFETVRTPDNVDVTVRWVEAFGVRRARDRQTSFGAVMATYSEEH